MVSALMTGKLQFTILFRNCYVEISSYSCVCCDFMTFSKPIIGRSYITVFSQPSLPTSQYIGEGLPTYIISAHVLVSTLLFQIAMNILNGGRFSMGSSGAGMLKKLIGKLHYVLNVKMFKLT